jgi:uncharacterized protein YecE (DUF72 family)
VKTRGYDEQPSLFRLAPRVLEGAPVAEEQHDLATQLPARLRLGTMSWSFPGWRGLIYGEQTSPKLLAAAGLTAYTKHPLLRTVEIDRSFYDPLPARYFAGVAEQVPDDFRFVVKAHEACTLVRYPEHARYGNKQSQPNPRYLDPAYATDVVVGPTVEGLRDKLGVLLFQFAPQDAGEARPFADRLHAFLEALPRGVPYAVELRNTELLTRAYAHALNGNAVHAHNVWGNMPSVLEQARLIPPAARKPLLIRWLMRRGDDYEGARSRFLPFSRLVEPDLTNRQAIATLLAKALAHGVPAFVVVNNKAEGCAPESIVELGRAVVRQRLGAES